MSDETLQKRKRIRLENYDYSSTGAYFITVCLAGRKPLLWQNVGAGITRPYELSDIGKAIDTAINQISENYSNVAVDKYCIMPDHIHMIIFILPNANGRIESPPTVSTVVGQMKRWVSRQIGCSIWQKSFIDHVIRNKEGYREIWKYIDNNPHKILYKNAQK